ncbi:MAG: hypothetical protein IGR76_11430 [Synechococcales cyanobacterium T60_A2020_003]|nr:hypothetical protein [Synechococcales cyanobacterium T60_A2020_003]
MCDVPTVLYLSHCIPERRFTELIDLKNTHSHQMDINIGIWSSGDRHPEHAIG